MIYKEDNSNWGIAISVGNLFKISNWSTEKTDIEYSLSGDNYKITCTIVYNSIELKDWVEIIKYICKKKIIMSIFNIKEIQLKQ